MANYATALHLVNVSAPNETIPTQWYKAKHHLSRLCIRNSNISDIESNAFNTDAFKQLYYIEFDGMPIKWFSNGMFNGLVSLKFFVLRNFHFYTFELNPSVSNHNPAQCCHGQEFQIERFSNFCSIRHECASSNFSTDFEVFYFENDNPSSSPWIILKKVPIVIAITLVSTFFSFSLGITLSFALIRIFRSVSSRLCQSNPNLFLGWSN